MRVLLLTLLAGFSIFALVATIDAATSPTRDDAQSLHQTTQDVPAVTPSVGDSVQGLKSSDRRYRYYD
jgi:hypothetical protein